MPAVATDRSTFLAAARSAAAGARVPVEVRVDAEPFAAYRRARDGTPGVFLETTGGQSGWGYFAVDPVDYRRIDPGDGSALGALAARLSDESLARGDCSVPYPCGAFGWLSYDVARELEALPGGAVRDRDLPRLELAVYDRVAAWREPHDGETTLRATACPRLDDHDDPAAAYERGRERALALARAATEGDPSVGPPPVDPGEGDSGDEVPGSVAFEGDCTRAAFAERVRRVKEHVRDGDTFQANVSQRLRAPAAVHPVVAYAALREVNPAPYSALVEFPACDLVSASPELLLERRGDRLVTEPIAGTRPRGKTPAADERLAADLRADEKERAEHAMLVDLERNDLGKVSEFGSVEVSDYRRIDRYSEVMHLVSQVEGRQRDDLGLADVAPLPADALPDGVAGTDADRLCAAVAAVFPGGTITGAPKPRTMEIIDEVEATRRGPYTGSVGAFGFDGRATLNIVIRTLVADGGEYHLRVGAGVVHDSDPDREYEETLDKGRALVTALDEALDRSLRVTDGTGSDGDSRRSEGAEADAGATERSGGRSERERRSDSESERGANAGDGE
ncbi:anthranilate synthase component I [Halobacteriales archaeon QS_5_70_17]|nr:MAG: anthranilate synthase component I [Halobacteriales archaeon QS_5_70_17]